MKIPEGLLQIESSIEKVQLEINDVLYFIENALCKETKAIYQHTLSEKQSQLRLLLSQKAQLPGQFSGK